MLPANFIEGRQSVKEITCDLIQVARAGASRTGRDGSGGSGGSGGRSIVLNLPQSQRGLTAGYVNTNLHEIRTAKNFLLYIISRIFT